MKVRKNLVMLLADVLKTTLEIVVAKERMTKNEVITSLGFLLGGVIFEQYEDEEDQQAILEGVTSACRRSFETLKGVDRQEQEKSKGIFTAQEGNA